MALTHLAKVEKSFFEKGKKEEKRGEKGKTSKFGRLSLHERKSIVREENFGN